MIKKCENCEYFNVPKTDNNKSGECRRYPRVAHIMSDTDGNNRIIEIWSESDFTYTSKDDWCGEFKKRNENENP